MKRGEFRYCACDCGQVAKRCYSDGKFKSWRAYASGHAPNETNVIRVPLEIASLAYAAGIIDGEGCIYARVHLAKAGRVSTYLRVGVSMCSESVVSWLAQNFGGDVYVQQPRTGAVRVKFSWQIRGKSIGIILESLLPFLIEKRQRATLAIELSRLIGESRTGLHKRISSPEMDRRREIASAIKAFNQNQRSEDAIQ